MANTAPSSDEPVRPGLYGDRVVAVEPGGIEFIPASERHGRPSQMLWTWIAPNLEFATVFIGVLAVGVFGLPFWQAVVALTIGTALGAIAHGLLSARGPRYGVPQMVLGRAAFGYWGNLLPSGLMAITAGIGWFAVNSVSGAFALSALSGLPALASLVIIVVIQIAIAFFGHNLVHAFERYALIFLGVVFAMSSFVLLGKTQPAAATHPLPGSFLLTVGTAFGYAAGWNPYAADYTRYLPESTSPRAVGVSAGFGLFIACMVLEIAGAASVTAGGTSATNPVSAFTGQLPTVLAHLTLLAVALGAIAANVLNTYSGAMAFLTMGIKLPLKLRRAVVALLFGAIGFLLAWSALADAGTEYTNFLLIIAYWIGPWLGVFFADQLMRRGQRVDAHLYDAHYRNRAGPVAMLIGMVVSILLFSNQELFVGFIARQVPDIGDITFLVGFVLAAGLYVLLRRGPD
ncbi:purine-cytosine permease family protein [Salinisphaera hydrothermalis]|uniref:purine-cytosine permease family protein n=1 Tax=Salinisphaera hydrothermalis TaxID=563188 RepID=UPI00333EF463